MYHPVYFTDGSKRDETPNFQLCIEEMKTKTYAKMYICISQNSRMGQAGKDYCTEAVAVAGSNLASCFYAGRQKLHPIVLSLGEKNPNFCTIWEDKRFSNYLTLVFFIRGIWLAASIPWMSPPFPRQLGSVSYTPSLWSHAPDQPILYLLAKDSETSIWWIQQHGLTKSKCELDSEPLGSLSVVQRLLGFAKPMPLGKS